MKALSLARKALKSAAAVTDLVLQAPAGPRVLIYHQVGAGLGRQMEVETHHFQQQVRWLAANREVVSLDEAVARWSEDDSDQLVVLTFDDGYKDTYHTAFPLLEEHRMPFVLYIATEAIEAATADDTNPDAPDCLDHPDAKLLDAAPRLRWLQSHGRRDCC